jgi:hypothetical protein
VVPLQLLLLNLMIIVFGGGGRRGGCPSGCLFWIIVSIVLSVGLTLLGNLVLFLISGPGSGGGTNV